MRFWRNIWYDDRSLKDLFPDLEGLLKNFSQDLFTLAVDKEVSIASYLANPSKGEVRHRNPHFI